jgi:hypothetical protein
MISGKGSKYRQEGFQPRERGVMKGVIIVISAALFVALMLTSCRNYYNDLTGPDEENLRVTEKQVDPEIRVRSPLTSEKGALAVEDAGSSVPGAYHVDLIADGGDGAGMYVGEVEVWNDADLIFVRYHMRERDWCLTETAVEMAGSLEEIPQNSGNPIIGKFRWKAELGSVREYTEVLPLEFEPGTPVFITAYASVTKVSSLREEEGAWGEGENFPGIVWAMYFTYVVTSPSDGTGREPSPPNDL